MTHWFPPATVGRYKAALERVLSSAEAKKDTVEAISYLRGKLEAFTPVLPKRLDVLLGASRKKE